MCERAKGSPSTIWYRFGAPLWEFASAPYILMSTLRYERKKNTISFIALCQAHLEKPWHLEQTHQKNHDS